MRALLPLALALLSCSDLSGLDRPCTSDLQCPDNRVCVAGECVVECYLDSDCDAGTCTFNRCRAPEADAGPDAAPADAATDAASTDAASSDATPDGA